MDPLSVLSTAAAVIQFVDFGSRLTNLTLRIYRSPNGQTSEVVSLSAIARDLDQLSSSIESTSASLSQSGGSIPPSQVLLIRLCGQCKDVSAQLQDALGRLKATKQSGHLDMALESVSVALRSVWSRGEITRLSEQLSSLREQIMMATLTGLWEQSAATARGVADLSQQRGENASQLVKGVNESSDKGSPTAAEAVWNSGWTPDGSFAHFLETGDTARLDQMEGVTKNEDCTSHVIDTLRFRKEDDREESIPNAHQKTFEWIFRKPEDSHQWFDFVQWLAEPSSKTYWITGKAGSGKSTLMKFISHHEITKRELKNWSGDLPLVMASFYFWNPGIEMQHSQEGLLRTLLRQCLSQMPHLAPKVCSRRWAFAKVFGWKSLREAPSWTWRELMESFSLLQVHIGKDFNLGLFVDGLDEFSGDANNIVDFVRLFHGRAGTKVCVSSRPWNVFSDAFHKCPSLQVQDLTKQDIERYVRDRFHATPGFLELDSASPGVAAALIDGILTKADGVFLWVALVVTGLTEGLTEGDTLQDLQSLLEGLPIDLAKLYQNTWDRIKPKYIGDCSQYFQILECSHEAADVLGFFKLWLTEPEQSPDLNLDQFSEERKTEISKLMRRRLNSRTKGLLEMSPVGVVDYLHRSVRDWIMTIWPKICAESRVGFDPNLVLLKAQFIDFSFWAQHESRGFDDTAKFWRRVVSFLRSHGPQVRNDEANHQALVHLLDSFDGDITSVLAKVRLEKPIPPLYEQLCFAEPHSQKALPHWSTTQRLDEINSPGFMPNWPSQRKNLGSNTMVGLAAQLCILPYVQSKVIADPSILSAKDTLSILACAVFGYSYFSAYRLWGINSLTNFDFDLGKRCHLIEFLLANGALSSKGGQIEEIGSTIYTVIRSRPFRVGPFRKTDGVIPYREEKLQDEEPPLDYWDEVQKLFEAEADFSEKSKFRTVLSRWHRRRRR